MKKEKRNKKEPPQKAKKSKKQSKAEQAPANNSQGTQPGIRYQIISSEKPFNPFAGRLDLPHSAHTVVGPGIDRDRSGPDRDRWRDRNRGKIDKDNIIDSISRNPIIDRDGRIRIPVNDKEPVWRPGRDQEGGGGGGGNGEAGDGTAEIELTYEEFAKRVFEALDLPHMLPKDKQKTAFTKSYKPKGTQVNGPDHRLLAEETVIKRIERAIAQLNAFPEEFADDFKRLCQETFERFIYWHAFLNEREPLVQIYGELKEDTALFVQIVETLALELTGLESFGNLMQERGQAYIDNPPSSQSYSNDPCRLPYSFDEQSTLVIEAYVKESIRQSTEVPSGDDVPLIDEDYTFRRLEVQKDPTSKAVVFLVLDRSGSMSGDPISLAKTFFFLTIVFLYAKYKKVELVMISHDSDAYEWKTEREFLAIGAGGGTVAVPAWNMVDDIYVKRYGSSWNAYMIHLTDGDLFDGQEETHKCWTKLVKDRGFSYCGYVEVGNRWGGWRGGGRMLLSLPAEIKARIGIAKANDLEGLVGAFKEMVTKDANHADSGE